MMAEASYDLVVLGATGFTGQLAAAYLAKNYPGSSRLKVSAAVGIMAACGARVARMSGVPSHPAHALQPRGGAGTATATDSMVSGGGRAVGISGAK